MSACASVLAGRFQLPSVEYEACIAWETLRKVHETISPFWKSLSNLQFNLSPGASSTNKASDERSETLPGSIVLEMMEPANSSADVVSSNQRSAEKPEASSSSAVLNESVDDAILQLLGLELNSELKAQLHAVFPLLSCPHLPQVAPVPSPELNVKSPCLQCGNVGENWICLTCYQVFCGRYVKEHGLMHHNDSGHPLCLSFADLSSWCHLCDAYVHNQALLPAKRAAHLNKFQTMPPD